MVVSRSATATPRRHLRPTRHLLCLSFTTTLRAAAALVALIGAPASTVAQEASGTVSVAATEVLNAGRISILTDGLTAATPSTSDAIRDLARVLDDTGELRLTPVSGYGGVQNIVDLLRLRGIDLAVVGADTLRFLDLEATLPEARRNIRLATRLSEMTVLVVARAEVDAIGGVGGATVVTRGLGTAEHVTGRTLLGELGITPTFRHANLATDLVAEVAAGRADAAVILTREADAVAADAVARGLTLLDIPRTEALLAVYEPRTLVGLAGVGSLATVQVPQVLAVFDWKGPGERYENIKRFFRRFFANYGRLRTMERHDVWQRFLPDRDVPGWEPYRHVAEELVATQAGRARIDAEFGPVLAAADAAEGRSVGAAPAPVAVPGGVSDDDLTASRPAPLSVAAVSEPPFTDQRRPDGGLLTELLKTAFEAHTAESPEARDAALVWIGASPEELLDLLSQQRYEAAFPVLKPDCERPGNITLTSALACDNFRFSAPILQTLYVTFARSDAAFDITTAEGLAGRTVCVANDQDSAPFVSYLDVRGIAPDAARIDRAATLPHCFERLTQGEVDLVLSNDLLGRAMVGALGLDGDIQMVAEPIGIATLHAVVLRDDPRADATLGELDAALAALRSSPAFNRIVANQLVAN